MTTVAAFVVCVMIVSGLAVTRLQSARRFLVGMFLLPRLVLRVLTAPMMLLVIVALVAFVSLSDVTASVSVPPIVLVLVALLAVGFVVLDAIVVMGMRPSRQREVERVASTHVVTPPTREEIAERVRERETLRALLNAPPAPPRRRRR